MNFFKLQALKISKCNESALRQLDHCYRFLTERDLQREEAKKLEGKKIKYFYIN